MRNPNWFTQAIGLLLLGCLFIHFISHDQLVENCNIAQDFDLLIAGGLMLFCGFAFIFSIHYLFKTCLEDDFPWTRTLLLMVATAITFIATGFASAAAQQGIQLFTEGVVCDIPSLKDSNLNSYVSHWRMFAGIPTFALAALTCNYGYRLYLGKQSANEPDS